MNLLKDKNRYLQLLLLILSIILLMDLCFPGFNYYIYSNSIIIEFSFGLSIYFNLKNFEMSISPLYLPYLLPSIFVIIGIVILIILLIYFNKLEKRWILGLGITIIILLLLYPMIYQVYRYILTSPHLFVSLSLLQKYIFFAMIVSIVIFTKIKNFNDNRIKKINNNKNSNLESNIDVQFQNHYYRILYILIGMMLILRVFIPSSIFYNSYFNTIYTEFLFGINTGLDLNTSLISYSYFFLPQFLVAIILIPIAIIMFMGSLRFKKMKKNEINIIGIVSIILIIIAIIAQEISTLIKNGLLVIIIDIPFDSLLVLSIAIIILSLIYKKNIT